MDKACLELVENSYHLYVSESLGLKAQLRQSGWTMAYGVAVLMGVGWAEATSQTEQSKLRSATVVEAWKKNVELVTPLRVLGPLLLKKAARPIRSVLAHLLAP